MKKIYLKQLLAAILLICSTVVSAETYSGTCGENVNWSLDTETGVLNISGTGEMTNYSYASLVPWNYYEYRILITSVIISDGVANIGNYAFAYCETITNITIPNSITAIGYGAFESCSSLTSIKIPNSITEIRDGQFRGCTSLTSITVESGNTKYDSRNNCNAIIETASNRLVAGCKNTIIPNSVTTIGAFSFCMHSSLTNITIPNGVTQIDQNAFAGCSSLTSITIPKSVNLIGFNAFDDCDALTSITVENDNTRYDSRDNCNGIIETANNKLIVGCKNTIFPNSVTSIGERAFSGRTNLTTIKIPNHITFVGRGAFEDTGWYDAQPDGRLYYDGWLLGYKNYIPTGEIIIDNDVKYIADYVFEHCRELTNISIPNSVITIGNNTFNGSSLTSITIPNSVTNIGTWAFAGCSSLTSVTIGNGVTNIGWAAFSNCSGLTSVTIGNSVTSIDDIAFAGCSGLTSIEIPSSVTSIGSGAFRGCSGLTSITIPNSVTNIARGAFNSCTGLTNIEIPNSITKIEWEVFQSCSSLTSVTIPNSVTTIGLGAFMNCSGLTEIIIPNSVTTIQNYVFEACSSLTSITIPNSVTNIGEGAFDGCSSLTSIEIPNSVTTIGNNTFSSCSGLTSVTIPNSVTSIGYSAFEDCDALTSIIIPNSVQVVRSYAFARCDALTDVYFTSNPQIESQAFYYTSAKWHLSLTDSDAADFSTANANTYADVSYTRTISEGKYGTIMLPFAPDEASLQNYAFYALKMKGEGYIRFEEVAAPEANTPYLYTLREGGENTAITGGETRISSTIETPAIDNWELIGSFTNQTIYCGNGNYYAYSAARNEINRITKTLTVRPYRAYLKSTAAQNSNLRVFIGGTTGVTGISPDDIEGFGSGAVYDLYGRPVNEPAKGGIYIIDGKKVVW